MADWDPSLYLQFSSERTRPAAELLTRIAATPAKSVADLGCGPGNSTALLKQAWPESTVFGIDSSPAMLEQARLVVPDGHFIAADIQHWTPDFPLDVLYANASLQWLPNHPVLFPRLISLLAENGVLAVQMPDNWQEPSHAAMRQVAKEMGIAPQERVPLNDTGIYYDVLTACGCVVDIWRTTYFHPMASHQAIIDWLRATGLRPFLQGMSGKAQQMFLQRYQQLLEKHYPCQQDGKILLAFPRLFIVARRVTS